MQNVTVHNAKTHLSRLLAEVEQGREFTICRGNQPVARLSPVRAEPVSRPKVGEITSGGVEYTEDCFAPLTDEELKDWGL
ncbi:MAG: type II toxin-antitoxin system Phd/YefM family antitoxin [Verrucomicrobiales bacterium]|nr:type II toxin-antitoxin system Phd/YefM family antitoxin [Verrucomicrobiales bacterium]